MPRPDLSRLAGTESWPGGHGDLLLQGAGGQGREEERRGSVLMRRLACAGAYPSLETG